MRTFVVAISCLTLLAVGVAVATVDWSALKDAQLSAATAESTKGSSGATTPKEKEEEQLARWPRPKEIPGGYLPRKPMDDGGYMFVTTSLPAWKTDASLAEISAVWQKTGYRSIDRIDQELAKSSVTGGDRSTMLLWKASLFNFEGEPKRAYETLKELRAFAESDETLAREGLYSIIMMQGVTALRIGENENCILCRGESSCILPISDAARHTNSYGSRQAKLHFLEYLAEFPGDTEVCWLLNLASMTLGEYPLGVDTQFLISLDKFQNSEFDIGKFRDIGHLVGINRLNMAGGAILEDFDNDGHLEFATTSFDPTAAMAIFHNGGKGKFIDQTKLAGGENQLGGLNCVQTDYNNDGFMDIFIVRGAWLLHPIRPSLLRNNKNGTFTDVTKEAGLLHAVNSISASWADYDNDGWLDLFICCEKQPSRLYRNLGNGTFEEVAEKAGLPVAQVGCKGSAWIDYDNDGRCDLFLNYLTQEKQARLFHNNGNGTFTDVSASQGINGPAMGFSCWAWDYDNDGWEDLFATSYDRTLQDVVSGLQGAPHTRESNRLYRNRPGEGFQDVTKEAGLDLVFSAMGSNFGDFDNDGYLDMYLGTGEPTLATLVPNRMLKNVGGKRFADITASSRTGSLQKGHGVACGDWDRDGDVDIFIEMGGALPGDKYHNILFQNPGNKNHWLTLKLIGEKSNRAAIGARIKVVTAGNQPQTIRRTITSGSSFGANPLQQTIGLGGAKKIALLQIRWPTSGTTQEFRDISADQALEITEFAEAYRKLEWNAVPIPSNAVPIPE